MKYYLLVALAALSISSLNAMDPIAKMAEIRAIVNSQEPVAEKIAALMVKKAQLPPDNGAGMPRFFHNHIAGIIAELNPAAHPVAALPGAAALGAPIAFGPAHLPAPLIPVSDSDSSAMDTDMSDPE